MFADFNYIQPASLLLAEKYLGSKVESYALVDKYKLCGIIGLYTIGEIPRNAIRLSQSLE
jgi:hypothetical protein